MSHEEHIHDENCDHDHDHGPAHREPGHVHGPGCNHSHAPAPVRSTKHLRPARNEPCHCGSGKKYKKCHMASDPM